MNMGSYQYLSQVVEPICTQRKWRLIKASLSRSKVEGMTHVEVHAYDTKHRHAIATVSITDAMAEQETATSIVQTELIKQIEEHEAKAV